MNMQLYTVHSTTAKTYSRLILFLCCFALQPLSYIQANQTQKPLALQAARLNSVLEKLLKQTDQIKSNLEYLGQALNKGAIRVANKQQVYRWIRETKEAVALVQNMHSLPLVEADLYKMASGIQILTRHMRLVLNNKFDNIATTEVPVPLTRNATAFTLMAIIALADTNATQLELLRNDTNNAGLTWVNKTARWLDKLNDTYRIVPFVETTLPISIALSVVGLYVSPNRCFFDPLPIGGADTAVTADTPDATTATSYAKRLFHPFFASTGISALKKRIGTSQLDPDLPETSRKIVKNQNRLYERTGYMDYILDSMQNQDIQAALSLISGVVLWSLSQRHLPYIGDARRACARQWDKLKGYTVPNTSGTVIVEGITLDDEKLIGIESQITHLRDLVLYITNPEIYDRSNSKLEKGILLTGPSGNGKTYLARALCGHLNKYAKAPAKYRFKELKWDEVSWNADGIKKLIEQARRDAPCVLFIDEIHNLRLQTKEGGETLTQFLTGMSGINSENDAKHQVILLAATNHPELLDPALLRPGRFGTIIRFEKPHYANRKKYFTVVFKHNSIDTSTLDLDSLARQTDGCSYSDLECIVQVARFKALSLAMGVNQSHLQERINTQVHRLKDDIPPTASEQQIVAAHLAGQALAHELIETGQQVEFVTIKGRWSKIEESRVWQTKDTHKQAPLVQDAKTNYGLLFTSSLQEAIINKSIAQQEKLGKIKTAGYLAERIILGNANLSYRPHDRHKALAYAKTVLLNGLAEDDLSKTQLAEHKNKAYELLKIWEQDTLKLLEDHKDTLTQIISQLMVQATLTKQELRTIINNTTSFF